MTTADTLLQAILAEPNRDDLRLIYADLLQEQGQEERAEFIRLQICLWWMQLDCGCKDCSQLFGRPGYRVGSCFAQIEGADLFRREQELLDSGCSSWNGMQFPASVSEWHWRRGFIEKIEMEGDAWVALADTLLAQHPIREVTLTSGVTIEQHDVAIRLAKGGRLDIETPMLVFDGLEISRRLLALNWPGISYHVAENAILQGSLTMFAP